MAKQRKKSTPARSLEELLRVSKELQAKSAKLNAEAKALSKKNENISERMKRLLKEQGD
jgi:hypothetical protein